jgi:hypothetical protein
LKYLGQHFKVEAFNWCIDSHHLQEILLAFQREIDPIKFENVHEKVLVDERTTV